MIYSLSQGEQLRLKEAIEAAFSVPFIDDVEDFVFEAILCYVKDIPIVDPLKNIRSKKLFDVVDNRNGRGWSVKSLQWPIAVGREFELVIQRADIFKKAVSLGYNSLSINTDPQILGQALMRHWYGKVNNDAQTQVVHDRRIAILLKSNNRLNYAYLEQDLDIENVDNLVWNWTDTTKTGLQGRRANDNFCVFRWYPNQKQLFERFILPEEAFCFEMVPTRIPTEEIIRLFQRWRIDNS